MSAQEILDEIRNEKCKKCKSEQRVLCMNCEVTMKMIFDKRENLTYYHCFDCGNKVKLI